MPKFKNHWSGTFLILSIHPCSQLSFQSQFRPSSGPISEATSLFQFTLQCLEMKVCKTSGFTPLSPASPPPPTRAGPRVVHTVPGIEWAPMRAYLIDAYQMIRETGVMVSGIPYATFASICVPFRGMS